MLILTRRVGECVVIGDSIEVSVLSVKGGQVRLGIKAPRDTPVHREEVIAGLSQRRRAGYSPPDFIDDESPAPSPAPEPEPEPSGLAAWSLWLDLAPLWAVESLPLL